MHILVSTVVMKMMNAKGMKECIVSLIVTAVMAEVVGRIAGFVGVVLKRQRK